MFSYVFQICEYRLTNNLLSTAQQVWLQKFGGAKNPISELSDTVIKEEEPQIRKSVSATKSVSTLNPTKSVSALTSTQKDAKQEVKLTSEGLRPGERWKVLTVIYIFLLCL